MDLIGLDLNASRARAVHGPMRRVPVCLRLAEDAADLPLALSLEGRYPQVGRAGQSLCRRLPYLACLDFLGHLGTERFWATERHRLDAHRALGLVFESLQRRFDKSAGVLLAVPAYLSAEQRTLLTRQAEQNRWRLLGSVATPLAATLAAQEELPWSGLALVLDVDGHALTWSAVQVEADGIGIAGVQTLPTLARGRWLQRLLDGVALRCIRECRRDPREIADAEQMLYEQLAQMLETPQDDGRIPLAVQTAGWYQRLTFHPDDLAGFCAPLVRQTLAARQTLLSGLTEASEVGAILLTAAAAGLPGMMTALEEGLQTSAAQPSSEDDDFGAGLLEERCPSARLHVLEADAVARAAHDLAVRVERGELPRGTQEGVPLPRTAPVDAGPARLHFRGQDHPLSRPVFTLGRDGACDLVFASDLYPAVSTHHCEIVFDHGEYKLRDRSRHGTLVNDHFVSQPVSLHPGDWIRLGPSGPVVRFLGQPNDQRKLMTTA